MMEQLKISQVTKKFGRHLILDDVSFTLEPAKIYGLLGRNGAGKSTLLNIISNRIFPTAGSVKLDDQEVNTDQTLGKIFLIGEDNLYYKQVKINQMFDLADAAYGNFDYKNAERMLKRFSLEGTHKFTKLSTGQKTAAKVTLALNVSADYIFLDEPVLGLDANYREVFYQELIKSYQARPRTIVLSTHLIDEIQRLIEHVILINNQQVLVDTDVEELLRKAYEISGPVKLVDQYTEGLNVLSTEDLGNIRTAHVFDKLPEGRVIPDQVQIGHTDLQHLFIYLTNEGGDKND
ncbi:ATP-binding cassette domain-containing protein [Limosilactobacillus fastidiosus]|uniref:ABC transporter ATP-binding protein n=1 Tax=Limosilactobacillus fastidiosus TaxID=2759855 RepID=A0A7W3TYE0_9LACO|nr:ABC transporter ATP-binding protein [Limosilactobacillus fastidiosus]MBB1062610.1 ABC transporter ATP-binding protein [Limosilactobacillus fastidiosus]MBB1085325.1 ABC transporter ATP-binding protein [Limosilactobacillus fastidiosus]MCD7083990.1 ABC transporter ATP-binding protein [Limosilactobacillus fastidiosus]MCD7084947.1 ABC transporter ATP-binding protein [Limosilactobacillus fastidiosus]MCD7113739.1 ABC transporter ATP-binding protein [Limosilactobacillus fastidiosus]